MKSSIAIPLGLILVLCFSCAWASVGKGSPRVQTDNPTVAELAAKIASAETAGQREALLERNKGLITVELDKALLEQANQLIKDGNPNRALDIFRLVGEQGARLPDQVSIAEARCGMAYIHYLQGAYPAAIEEAQRGLALSERIGYKAGMACALNNLGRVENNRSNYIEAVANFERALGLERETGDRAGMARTLNAMGVSQWYQGNYAGAIDTYKTSLSVAKELGDKFLVANTLHNVGLAERDQGDYGQALDHLEESLKIRREFGDKSVIAPTLVNIGIVHANRGDYSQALQYLRRGLDIAEALGDKATSGFAMLHIGSAQRGQGNYLKAMEFYRKSQRIASDIGEPFLSEMALGELATAQEWTGDQAAAIESYGKALKIATEVDDKANILASLEGIGRIERSRGNDEEALQCFRKNLEARKELGDKGGIAESLLDIGIVYYSRGRYADAIEVEERSASITRQIGDPDLLVRALTAAGRAYQAIGKFDKAGTAFADAISGVEALRNQMAEPAHELQRFLENRIAPFHGMVDLLIEQKNQREALSFAEEAKARALLDVLRSGKTTVNKSMSGEESAAEQRLNSRLVSLSAQTVKETARQKADEARLRDLRTQLDNARFEFEEFQDRLYSAHPELKVRRGKFEPFSLKECKDLLPDAGAVLLEFLVEEDKTILFVITRNPAAGDSVGLESYVSSISRQHLVDLCEQFRRALSDRNLEYDDSAVRLFDLLIKPAVAQLRGAKSLIIVPDGPLWDMPFQALKAVPSRFLAEDYAISYAPSLTALREMLRLKHGGSRGRRWARSLLAMGNPAISKATVSTSHEVFMDAELAPLPQAERQVRALARLYGPSNSEVFVGSAATEERFKSEAARYRILHLATHGVVNDASPMYSQLYLSQANSDNDDGVLEAWEIMELNLNADLVVLSACETARGRISEGEGVIGLSWAVFVAGCPSTVVSQWKVDADATTALMIGFHKNLRAGMSKAEALRRAQVTLIKSRNYNHPFYWAAFVVIGNPY